MTDDELRTLYYRWWTVKAWLLRCPFDMGVKLGPLSVGVYRWDGWQFCLVWMGGIPWIDTGLSQHRQQKPSSAKP